MNRWRGHRAAPRNLLLGAILTVVLFLPAANGGPDGGSLAMPVSNAFLSSLSEEERTWLRDHPVIRLIQDPGWPPIEFADEDGNPSGMSRDYVDLVERRLGRSFDLVRNVDWQEGYSRLKRWDIDLTTSVASTPEREQFLAFTKPYMTIPIVIATGHEVTYIAHMSELTGKKVAVVDGYAVSDWIPRDFPDIQLVRVKNAEQGLMALQRGEVFAYIDNLLIIGHYQARMKVTNIKIAGETPYVNAQAMAVRKDWAVLAGILDKALDSISETERSAVYKKWLPIRYEHGFNSALLWQSLAIFAAILLGLVVWNRKLVMEMKYRRQAEAAKRDVEARHRMLFEHSPDGIVIIDPATARILEFNEAAHLQLGYSREEFAQLNIFDLETAETPAATKERIRRVMHERRNDFETQHRTKQGQIRNVHVTAQFSDMLGRPVYHCVWRDITDHKAAERQAREAIVELERSRMALLSVIEDQKLTENALRQSEEEIKQLNAELEKRVLERTAQLEAANKELEAFSYSVSHDLRAPLRAVDGFTRMLLEDHSPQLDSEGRRLCNVISDNARNMGQLIDDLLTLSRMGRSSMKMSSVDMEGLANAVFHELTTPESRARIDCRVGHMPRALGDPTLMRQVWMNLLGNAIKFSSRKERALIEVFAEQCDGEVVYSVRDNGAGFDMKYADKLFGVFQRLHSAREFEGTGVGLAIVQRIVHRHGGRVWGQGEVEKGATLCFTVNKGD